MIFIWNRYDTHYHTHKKLYLIGVPRYVYTIHFYTVPTKQFGQKFRDVWSSCNIFWHNILKMLLDVLSSCCNLCYIVTAAKPGRIFKEGLKNGVAVT